MKLNTYRKEQAVAMLEVALLISLVSLITLTTLKKTGRKVACKAFETSIVIKSSQSMIYTLDEDYDGAGDFNGDSCADLDDLTMLAAGFGSPLYNLDSFTILAANFGKCGCR